MKAIMLFACMALTSISIEAKEFVSEENTITESVVLFAQDKSKVSADGVKKLGKLSFGKTEIIGFASSEGSYDYNMALSKRRADFVAGVLNRPHSIVSAVGESDANPLMDYRDRKVTIRVTTTEMVYNPIFDTIGELQGPLHSLTYNAIPIR